VTTAAVVLAAGGGSRFTGDAHKLLADFRGRPLVAWAIEAAIGAGLDEVVIVEGAISLVGVAPPDVTLLSNPRWVEGQATSLGVAIGHARACGHDAVVVGLGDQPLVSSEAWRRVAAAPIEPPIAVATYEGRRGNPVRLGAAVWHRLRFVGDEGARELMRREPTLSSEVACGGNPADVDTVEDLEQWS